MSYRVLTDQGGFHYVYQGDSVAEAISAFLKLRPQDDTIELRYDRHRGDSSGDPVIAMHRLPDQKTMATLHGVTWEEWEKVVET